MPWRCVACWCIEHATKWRGVDAWREWHTFTGGGGKANAERRLLVRLRLVTEVIM